MPLHPPRDFAPPVPEQDLPTERELRQLWDRHDAARRERERVVEWRRTLDHVRREPGGELVSRSGTDGVPAYVRDRLAVGPCARGALRPVPRGDRVIAAGVDTWSPCWYAKAEGPLHRALDALATERTRLAWLLPEKVAGYRVGWFREHGLVFAEGRPGANALTGASELPAALCCLQSSLEDLGVPVSTAPSAGLRRLDVAADLWMDSAVEGLAFLECVGSASLGAGKLVAYRASRRVESVLIKTRANRTKARLYDKGAQSGRAPSGRWIRLEAQWRFPRAARPAIEQLVGFTLRERFARRFDPLWQAAEGLRLGGFEVVSERLAEAVEAGRIAPSRARSIAGYLVLRAAGVPQGAPRTEYELDRDCRELGLSVALAPSSPRYLDAATVLDECFSLEAWE